MKELFRKLIEFQVTYNFVDCFQLFSHSNLVAVCGQKKFFDNLRES